jgi:hypothetical protein
MANLPEIFLLVYFALKISLSACVPALKHLLIPLSYTADQSYCTSNDQAFIFCSAAAPSWKAGITTVHRLVPKIDEYRIIFKSNDELKIMTSFTYRGLQK